MPTAGRPYRQTVGLPPPPPPHSQAPPAVTAIAPQGSRSKGKVMASAEARRTPTSWEGPIRVKAHRPWASVAMGGGPAGDRTFPLPPGLRPEAGAAAVASGAILLVARQAGAGGQAGPRHLYVLDLTSGEVKDAMVDLPPEAGPPPMATDAQGRWAFTRIGPSQLVGVRLASAEAITFPFDLEPWGAIAVTAGGACECGGGGGGRPTV